MEAQHKFYSFEHHAPKDDGILHFRHRIESHFLCKVHFLPPEWLVDCIVTRKTIGIGWGFVRGWHGNIADAKSINLPRVCYDSGIQMSKRWAGWGNVEMPLVIFAHFNEGDFRANVSKVEESSSGLPPAIVMDADMVYIPAHYFKKF